MDGVCSYDCCDMQAYLEMAQELVIDENSLLQTLGMLHCTVSVCVHVSRSESLNVTL